MRTSVFSVGGSPSWGSRCRNSIIGLVDCQSGSSRVPSSFGARPTRVVSALSGTISPFELRVADGSSPMQVDGYKNRKNKARSWQPKRERLRKKLLKAVSEPISPLSPVSPPPPYRDGNVYQYALQVTLVQ